MTERRLEQRALDLALRDLDGTEPGEVDGLDALLSLVEGCYWSEYWNPGGCPVPLPPLRPAANAKEK